MDPQDFVDGLYRSLLEQGWVMTEIDSMDVMYYLGLLKRGIKKTYIDDLL